MAPQFSWKAQQAEYRWLSPLLPSSLAVVSLIATVDPASLAAAAEYQVTEEGGTTQGMPTYKGTASSILPLTVAVERDIYGEFVPYSVREIAPYMKTNRTLLGNTENQEIATIGACLSQDIREGALFNQTLMTSIGKTQVKAHKPVRRAFALPYNGKRQVLAIRTTPPEIGVHREYTPATVIGPVQGVQKPILSDERSVSQAVAMLPTAVDSLSLFGGQYAAAVNPLQSALQLPGNESSRMNMTTTRTLHGGNCASGCP